MPRQPDWQQVLLIVRKNLQKEPAEVVAQQRAGVDAPPAAAPTRNMVAAFVDVPDIHMNPCPSL